MMEWSGKKVLVTGAGGFIGSHLVEQLVERGAQVRCFIHYRYDSSWGWLDRSPVKDDIEVVAGDIRDIDSVSPALSNIDLAFHLAAIISVPHSVYSPLACHKTNTGGTCNILDQARHQGVERLVLASTSEVYGKVDRLPMNENHPLWAKSGYAASKIAADKLAESYHAMYGLPVVTVRPFNVFGPRQSERAMVPSFIVQALKGGPIQVGNPYSRRDLTFVDDTVDGFLKAAEKGEPGETYVLGTGENISVRALAQLVAKMGHIRGAINLEVVHDVDRDRPRAMEVTELRADSSKAKKVLGWAPSYTLEAGLELTIDWFEQNIHAYRNSFTI